LSYAPTVGMVPGRMNVDCNIFPADGRGSGRRHPLVNTGFS